MTERAGLPPPCEVALLLSLDRGRSCASLPCRLQQTQFLTSDHAFMNAQAQALGLGFSLLVVKHSAAMPSSSVRHVLCRLRPRCRPTSKRTTDVHERQHAQACSDALGLGFKVLVVGARWHHAEQLRQAHLDAVKGLSASQQDLTTMGSI